MNWFLFGSLMDQQVMEIVAGRTVLEEEMIVADLPGYRRVRVANESYPALVQSPGDTVEGILVESLDANEGLRMLYFEGDEYKPEEIQLRLKNQKPVSAFTFLASPDLPVTDEAWDFDDWQERYLEDFLELSDEWMNGYGEMDFKDVNDRWLAHRKTIDI